MSKKSKKLHQPPSSRQTVGIQPIPKLISRRGWKVIGAGLGLLILGYGVLSQADSMAQNWAGLLSPFLILGAYAIIGLGIVIKDPTQIPPTK